MKARYWLFLFIGLLTLVRLACIGWVELSPDEAYYYLWSQHLDWCYFSKGPGVALAIRVGTDLFGPSEFGVRFFSPLLGAATSLLLFFFTRRLYNEQAAIWTVIALNMIPIFQVGSLVMTIDPLSIFFWVAALFSFWLALEKAGNTPSWSHPNFWWPLTGLLIGAGVLSKYTNAMQLLSIVLVLGCTRKFRGEFAKIGFYSMLAIFACVIAPLIFWNQNHEWVTWSHLKTRGGMDSGLAVHPMEFLKFLRGQFGVYSPLVFAGMLVAIWRAWPMARTQFKVSFLLSFSLPLLGMYCFLSFKSEGEPNWTAPGFITIGILAVALWRETSQNSWFSRVYAVVALLFGLALSLVALNTDAVRSLGIHWPYEYDPSARLYGWKSAAEQVEDLRSKIESELGEPVFLISNKYQTASELAFYLKDKRMEGPGHPPVYMVESQNFENQFSFWPRYDEFVAPPAVEGAPLPETAEEEFKQIGASPFAGRSALYITDGRETKPPTAIKSGFETVEMRAMLELKRHNEPLRSIRVFACRNYRGLQL